jgi:hypothetical protein
MEITHAEEVSDADSQESLQSYAARRLAELSSAVEAVVLTHSYHPYNCGDVIKLIYNRAYFEFSGVSVNKTVALEPGMTTTTRLRRFIRG